MTITTANLLVLSSAGCNAKMRGGRHRRQNEIRIKAESYESSKILDTCVPLYIDIKFRTIYYILTIYY